MAKPSPVVQFARKYLSVVCGLLAVGVYVTPGPLSEKMTSLSYPKKSSENGEVRYMAGFDDVYFLLVR